MTTYNKTYYSRNKEKIQVIHRRSEIKSKMKVFRHYSRSEISFCACCGEDHVEFLTIDHINGRRKSKRSGAHLYRWLIRHNYPKGYQVLCMNCNFAKGKFGGCPHERDLSRRNTSQRYT